MDCICIFYCVCFINKLSVFFLGFVFLIKLFYLLCSFYDSKNLFLNVDGYFCCLMYF